MTDLAGFLRTRLDEEEIAARMFSAEPRWRAQDLAKIWGQPEDDPIVRHAAYYDPARVLREIEAKRRVVDECSTDVSYEEEGMANTILALLALPYVDHPDYDEAWRPDATEIVRP